MPELSRLWRHRWQYWRENFSSYLSYLTYRSKFVTYYLCISRDLWAASRFFYFWIFALSSFVNLIFSLSAFSSPIQFFYFWICRVFTFLLFLDELSGVEWPSWLSVNEANEFESAYSFIYLLFYDTKNTLEY